VSYCLLTWHLHPTFFPNHGCPNLQARQRLFTLCKSEVCRGVEQTAGPSTLICQSLTLLSREQLIRWRSVTHAAPKSQSLCPCACIGRDVSGEVKSRTGQEAMIMTARPASAASLPAAILCVL